MSVLKKILHYVRMTGRIALADHSTGAAGARQRHSAGDRRRDAAAGGRCADSAGLVPAIHVEGVADDRRIAGRRLGGP